MSSSVSSSSSSSISVPPHPHEPVVRRPKVDGSNSSSFAKSDNSFIPYYGDALNSWFKDLNAYLGFSAANLSRVCRKAHVLQDQFRFTHLFRAILSSQEFRHRLCRREEEAIDHLNSKTTSLVNRARSLKKDVELLKQTNPQARKLQQQKIREQDKLAETYERIGRCGERTLVDIFTQSFRFPDPKVFCIRDGEQIAAADKSLGFDQWVSRPVTPAAEAIELLSKLSSFVRGSINTLDFTGNLLFSRYFGGDRKTSEELSNVLRSCYQGIPKKNWRIRHIIINDKMSGVSELVIALESVGTPSFSELTSGRRIVTPPSRLLDVLNQSRGSIERLNLRALKDLNFYNLRRVLPLKLKELRVSSMLINDEIFQFFKGGLEILDIDWEQACTEGEDLGDKNAPRFEGDPLKVDEAKVTSALKKSRDTLQELRMTHASITGRFLVEADLSHLKKLHLRYCNSLDENSLISFFTKADKLTDIDFSGTNISGASLASIKGPVKKLSLRRCSHLDPDALGVFLQTIAQSLEVLQVDFAKIAGAFKNIPMLPKLKEFSFSGGSFNDEKEVHTILANCPNLDKDSKEYLQDEFDWL